MQAGDDAFGELVSAAETELTELARAQRVEPLERGSNRVCGWIGLQPRDTGDHLAVLDHDLDAGRLADQVGGRLYFELTEARHRFAEADQRHREQEGGLDVDLGNGSAPGPEMDEFAVAGGRDRHNP